MNQNHSRSLALCALHSLLLLQTCVAFGIEIMTTVLPTGTVGARYFVQLSASGVAPHVWSIVPSSAPLPEGLVMRADGVVAGASTIPGLFNLTVHVADANGSEATKELSLNILPRHAGRPLEWDRRFLANGMPPFSVTPYVYTLFASGTNLYAAGRFLSAGGFSGTYDVARWDGQRWFPLQDGLFSSALPDPSTAMAITGGGTNIYFSYEGYDGSPFAGVAAWNGQSWKAIGKMRNAGALTKIYALLHVNGDLYAAGRFKNVDGLSALNIARWDGVRWFTVGAGLNSDVYALESIGSAVFAGGAFTNAGGTPAFVAQWNGSVWSDVGGGVSSTAYALAASGSDLYVGGRFTNAGNVAATNIAKWNGANWAALGSGVGSGAESINAFAAYQGFLYVGGIFTTAGGTRATNFAIWNGTNWSAFGSGLGSTVFTIAASELGIYAGGSFTNAGATAVNCIAQLGENGWDALGRGVGQGYHQSPATDSVNALAVSGGDVYAGGTFRTAGAIRTTNVARWDGNNWWPLGGGVNGAVRSLAAAGEILYAGGTFTSAGGAAAANIASWNGFHWSPLGSGVNGAVRGLCVDGTNLFAAGAFTRAGAVNDANGVAKWNGTTWSGLGGGLSTGLTPSVNAVAGTETNLYIGGSFTAVGGMSGINSIAKWNGSVWSPLGSGINGIVNAITVSETNVYVGGSFLGAGGEFDADRIARWDGNKWSALPMQNGPTRRYIDAVNSIVVRGSSVYIGGRISDSIGGPSFGVARWDGTNWSMLGAGLSGTVNAFGLMGAQLHVGGAFTRLFNEATPSQNFAIWNFSNGVPSLVFEIVGGNAQTCCRLFPLEAAAHDLDGAVTNITLFRQGSPIASFAGSSLRHLTEIDYPGNYTLLARAEDDNGGTAWTTQTVSIVSAPLNALIAAGRRGSSGFKLCLSGVTGRDYEVLANDDLNSTTWLPIGQMEATNGIWRYFDTNAVNPHRFYRARQLP